MKKSRGSLTQKALIAVLIILLPILITFVFSYYKSKELIKAQFLEDLNTITEISETHVYQFLEMADRRMKDFASDGLIRKELDEALKGNGGDAARLSDYLVKNKLPLETQIHDLNLISLDGKIISSTDASLVGTDVSNEPFFIDGRSGKAFTEVAHKTSPFNPELAVSAPVNSPGGKPLGILTGFINLSVLEKVLNRSYLKESGAISWSKGQRQTLEIYLVNKDMLMLTSSRFIKDAVMRQKVNTEPVRACLSSGKEITDFYMDYRDIEVAGASMCIPSVNWTLIVEVDAAEAYIPVEKIRIYAIITSAVVAMLIGFLFIFFRKLVFKLREVSDAALNISQGNYDTIVPVSTNDELGALSEAFNFMAGDIKIRSLALQMSERRLNSILDNSTAVVYLKDTAGCYIFVNQSFEKVFSLKRLDIIGKTDYDIFPKEAAGLFRANDLKVIEKNGPIEFEEAVIQDGEPHTYISNKFPLFDSHGVPYAVCGFSTDITERKKASEALKESEGLLKKAQQIARLGSWDWDIINNRLYWSDEIYRIFGLSPQEFGATYEAFMSRVHRDDKKFVNDSVNAALSENKPYSIDHRIVISRGIEKIVHEEANITYDDNGKPIRMVGTVQDITERKRAEFEFKKLSMAIESSVNIVFITRSDGTIEYVNPMFEKVTGFSKEEAVGQTPRILASGEVPNETYELLWKTILSGKTWRSAVKNKRKSGGYYWANVIISPIMDERGEITHFLAVQEDTTEKMQSEERIKFFAEFDPLTGVTNRSRFMELLNEWIDKYGNETGILFLIDMDQFKFINDTLGHGTGDELLRRVAKLLKSNIERLYNENKSGSAHAPLFGRMSGDEFAAFLPMVGIIKGLEIAEAIRLSVSAHHFPESSGSLTLSAGIVIYPEHARNTKDLFIKADAAMYRAKELGRNKFHVYRPEDQDLEKMVSRLSWKEKILEALKESRFEPWFQPILSLDSNTIHHYEVLARLRGKDGSILLPGAFIDIAERFGIIGLIDRMIIEKAMKLQASLRLKGEVLSFGMNLSGKEIGDEELLSFLKAKITETGADPKNLVFEITETAAIADLEKAKKFIRSLQEIGCKFSLDDFGVGFTSFTYLKEMQVDYIKIDGSFIRKLNENPDDQIFVKAITDVAKGLKIYSIAEFVENETTLNLLKKYGVDHAQGYYIGKPAPELRYNDIFQKSAGEKKPVT